MHLFKLNKLNNTWSQVFSVTVVNLSIQKAFFASEPDRNNSPVSDGNNSPVSDRNNSPVSDGNNSPVSDGGYETDSNRSYVEQGAEAMADYPVERIPDDLLSQFIRDTEDIINHPETAGIEDDEESLQIWKDRYEELKAEDQSRRDQGLLENSSESEENGGPSNWFSIFNSSNETSNNIATTDVENNHEVEKSEEKKPEKGKEVLNEETKEFASSSTKRKYEELDSPDSPQPSKKIKQDSSDIYDDGTEMPNYGWGSDID